MGQLEGIGGCPCGAARRSCWMPIQGSLSEWVDAHAGMISFMCLKCCPSALLLHAISSPSFYDLLFNTGGEKV